jgi:hypothetical protein
MRRAPRVSEPAVITVFVPTVRRRRARALNHRGHRCHVARAGGTAERLARLPLHPEHEGGRHTRHIAVRSGQARALDYIRRVWDSACDRRPTIPLAVGLRTVDAGQSAAGAEVGQGIAPGEALAVGPGVSVRTRSMRSMPCAVKKAAARRGKDAQVAAFSSGWISLWARRVWSSTACSRPAGRCPRPRPRSSGPGTAS